MQNPELKMFTQIRLARVEHDTNYVLNDGPPQRVEVGYIDVDNSQSLLITIGSNSYSVATLESVLSLAQSARIARNALMNCDDPDNE